MSVRDEHDKDFIDNICPPTDPTIPRISEERMTFEEIKAQAIWWERVARRMAKELQNSLGTDEEEILAITFEQLHLEDDDASPTP